MAPPQSLEGADLLRLHDRVLGGDLHARDAITALLLKTCFRRLHRAWPGVDPADVRDSVDVAVLTYLVDPRSFDPTKGGLELFVELVARRDVMDRLRADRARHTREAAWAEERARLFDPPKIGGGPRTAHDVWPLLVGSQRPLTDHQWILIESLFSQPPRGGRGRPPAPIRPILDAVIELLRDGGHRQDLCSHPADRTCSRYFRHWCRSGVLREALDRLEADLRRVPRSTVHSKGPPVGQRS